jgi:hypothetical protein
LAPTRLTPEEALKRVGLLKALQDLLESETQSGALVSFEEAIEVLKETLLWFRQVTQNTKFQLKYRTPEYEVGETDTSVSAYTITGELSSNNDRDSLGGSPRVVSLPSATTGSVVTKQRSFQRKAFDEVYRPLLYRLSDVLYLIAKLLVPLPSTRILENLILLVKDWATGKTPNARPAQMNGRIGYLVRQAQRKRNQ